MAQLSWMSSSKTPTAPLKVTASGTRRDELAESWSCTLTSPTRRSSGTIGEVQPITQCSESQLDNLFDVLPLTHPAKAPYSLYQRASDSVRSGVISGLGSRLQVFQSDLIKKITAYDEISLELPGQQPCAYYLVTSDQDSTFDFLASLFLSVVFIKLVR